MRRLKGGLPRRFKDHRTRTARLYREAYLTIVERYQPRDRLAARVTAMASDLLLDYETLRQSKAATSSAKRKTAGLFLGALRELSRTNHKPEEPFDLLGAELARQGFNQGP